MAPDRAIAHVIGHLRATGPRTTPRYVVRASGGDDRNLLLA